MQELLIFGTASILMKAIMLIMLMVTLIAVEDSQAQALSSVDTREELVRIFQAADNFIHNRPDTAAVLAREAMKFAQAMRDDSMLMESYFLYCRVNQMQTLFDTALHYTRKAGRIAFQNQYEIRYGEYYNFMARYHKYLTHPDSALYYLQTYDAFLEKRGSSMGKRWLPQQEMALFYLDLLDYEKANAHIEQALHYARLERKPMDYPYVLYSAIDIYSRQDNHVKVSALSEEYLTYKTERGANILDPAMHMHLWLPLSDSTDKLVQLEALMPVHMTNGDLLSALNAYHTIGGIYASQANYPKSVDAYEKALLIANGLNYPNFRYTTHVALYRIHDQLKNTSEAFAHLKAVNSLMDTIRNEEREKLMRELEVKYETARKEHELAQANYDLERARRTQLLYGLAGVILLMIIAMIFFAYRQKRKSATQLAEKNAIITRSLTEKDILLREIHHRVKNNLQMISALLYLHGKSVESSSAQEALLESQNRVQSMAMIHQNLYQDSNLLGVSVKDYLDKLMSHLIASYNVEKERIRISSRIEIDHLDVDTIVPVALIVNELISNSLKYAFLDGRQGNIDVFIGEVNNQILVEVKDNGMGMRPGSPASSSNFGYKLINILSERLNASLTTEVANGTNVTLTIPMKKAA